MLIEIPQHKQTSSRHLRGDAANQFGDHQIHLEKGRRSIAKRDMLTYQRLIYGYIWLIYG